LNEVNQFMAAVSGEEYYEIGDKEEEGDDDKGKFKREMEEASAAAN